MNCIASPISIIASPPSPKCCPPTYHSWTNFTAREPSTLSNPQVHELLLQCCITKLSLFHTFMSCYIIIFQNYLGTSLFYKNVTVLAMTYLLQSNNLTTSEAYSMNPTNLIDQLVKYLTPRVLRGQILAFSIFGQAPTSAINF
jgi:hypothetical protein